MRLHHTVSHALGQARAHQVLDEACAHYAERYPLARIQSAWSDPGTGKVDMHVGGFHLRAQVAVTERELTVDLDVPLLARPWVPKIRARIDREIDFWVNKNASQAPT